MEPTEWALRIVTDLGGSRWDGCNGSKVFAENSACGCRLVYVASNDCTSRNVVRSSTFYPLEVGDGSLAPRKALNAHENCRRHRRGSIMEHSPCAHGDLVEQGIDCGRLRDAAAFALLAAVVAPSCGSSTRALGWCTNRSANQRFARDIITIVERITADDSRVARADPGRIERGEDARRDRGSAEH